MPISDRTDPKGAGRAKAIPALFACAVLALSGCQMALPTASGNGNALPMAELDAGQITVRGPAGYCIDAKSLRSSGARQFALVAQCDLLTRGEIEGVSSLSFMTVTAVRSSDDTPLPTASQIAATFGPAKVLNQTTRNGVIYVQLSDGGQRATRNATPVHWRGVMQVAGHTLGLAAYSTEGGAASGRGGRDLLMSLVTNIRQATTGTVTGDSIAVQKPDG